MTNEAQRVPHALRDPPRDFDHALEGGIEGGIKAGSLVITARTRATYPLMNAYANGDRPAPVCALAAASISRQFSTFRSDSLPHRLAHLHGLPLLLLSTIIGVQATA